MKKLFLFTALLGGAAQMTPIATAQPQVENIVRLDAAKATVTGITKRIRLENDGVARGWTLPDDALTWSVKVPQGAKYRVLLDYALDAGSDGAELSLEIGAQSVKFSPPATGAWENFASRPVGEIALEAGTFTATLRALKKPGYGVLNLKSIQLLPPGAAPQTEIPPGAPQAKETPAAISELLKTRWGKFFRIARRDGVYEMGDKVSHFNGKSDVAKLSFDISNAKILANVGAQGNLRAATVYRSSYRSSTANWPGVWMAKDLGSYGPYSFTVETEGQSYDLAKVDWDFQSGLLDNLVPITELTAPNGRFAAKILTFAPLAADGALRVRGVVYALQIENTGAAPLRGIVRLPKLFNGSRGGSWAQNDPFDFEMALGDYDEFSPVLSFNLAPGRTAWIPAILYQPGEAAPQQINARGVAAWLGETLNYYRRVLGRMQTPDEPFLAEFYERGVMQALQSLAMDGRGDFAGSNWGSYPATRMIWMKDCFYSCLPFAASEPQLAQKTILWFSDYGTRAPGVTVKDGKVLSGGVNHSVSLSVAGVLLASLYYDQTGDKTFFRSQPQLQAQWRALLDEIIASRRDENVWLFPTMYISDGPVQGDYHTGSNLCVWRALRGYARLCAEVYNDTAGAEKYAAAADKVQGALREKTLIGQGAARHYEEVAWRDGRAPKPFSDGEESDTTLMPFYGFTAPDDADYLATMRFAMSAANTNYNAKLRALKWGGVPSTSPGYNKGLAAGVTREELFGEHGFYTEMRRVTDADGSVWWWSYGGSGNAEYGAVQRAFQDIGKAGWTSGVHSALFPAKFLGVAYDAPLREFRFAPLPAVGAFSWDEVPFGNARFSVEYSPQEGSATFKNRNDFSVRLRVTLPGKNMNLPGAKPTTHYGAPAQSASVEVAPRGAIKMRVEN